MQECEIECRAHADPCRQEPEPGNCLESYDSWYFNARTKECEEFTYTGCHGNDNRFATKDECEIQCSASAVTTRRPVPTTRAPVVDTTLSTAYVPDSRRMFAAMRWTQAPASTLSPSSTGISYLAAAYLSRTEAVKVDPIASPLNLNVKKFVVLIIPINGDVGRYRLLSDGALEIVSLYRNDSGVYICIANNELGSATQEVTLHVDDPVEGPAGVANIPNEEIFGDLGQPLRIRCLVYGYPTPTIYWYRGLNGPMVPYSSSLYEARDNVLLIRKLNEETIGEYACHAYNGIGSSAIWPFVVQASRPDGSVEIPKHVTQLEVPVTTPQIQTQASTTPAPENQVPLYAVPVTTRINAERTQVVAGSEIRLACDVDGYPEPRVQWTKDRMQLTATDRIQITETRLTIFRAQSNDSGEYSCEAANEYTSHSSVINVTVKGIYIPPTCVDSPYFADCHLIIRSNYCRHKYYSKFCCKSCVEAGQLEAEEAELMQADMSFRRKK
ncbi:papilin-like isoform X3 [Leptidea sinapis]|uniref:papilin-like isoform X3 n=1 Tax=Leptidea sinapis TaxID=189913 RepID=UPI0021C3ABF2|nr:papilin-like isoform X3 [Leptidea sinapis]